MPSPWNYEDRLWVTKILGHMTYEEAYRQRHKIAFRPHKKDRTRNIHSQWVFKVEWELFNGHFIQTWEIEERLVHWKELVIYKERNNIVEERPTIYTRYRWSINEEDRETAISNDDTITS
ncbi:hypothetical protein KIN20_031415 [Parelaphostrongylus tenuis]|uniref:Uncharacterized protein n=1 Tax=Parelaphostrongylus tenuis TaxID=148309 RepID=A0AAD5R540_PARTN|nr:hypothetical protein KIN20_031415 [Parelaphostrongylus tenuis]